MNDDGSWEGHGMGTYTYTVNLPHTSVSADVIAIGEWHLRGTGAYEGLQLDLHTATEGGAIGTITPVED